MTPEDRTAIKALLEEVHDERFSLRKNGHSWRSYFGKLVTPDRLLWLAAMGLLISYRISYRFGNEVAVYRADQAQQQVLESTQRQIQTTQGAIMRDIAELQTSQEQIGREIAILGDRISVSLTRTEQSQRALEDQILPRLRRIERLSEEDR